MNKKLNKVNTILDTKKFWGPDSCVPPTEYYKGIATTFSGEKFPQKRVQCGQRLYEVVKIQLFSVNLLFFFVIAIEETDASMLKDCGYRLWLSLPD